MGERDKPPRGDQSGSDFPDWDNPEDVDEAWEDAPEGYYDEDDEEDGGYIPGPEDPDYDLSEAAGYAGWREPKSRGIIPQWVIAVISILLILAIVVPLLLRP